MAKLVSFPLSLFVVELPIENTYLITKDIPNVKLTKEIVLLNYGHLSPFKNGDLIYIKEKNKLFIWFTKTPLKEKKIHIPEGYALYRNFRDKRDVIVIYHKASTHSIIVIKEGSLKTQIVTSNLTDTLIEAIKKEHSIDNAQIVHTDSLDRPLTVADIAPFFHQLQWNPRKIVATIYEDLKLPVIVLLLFINLAGIVSYKYTNTLLNERKAELRRLKLTNEVVKKEFAKLENISRFYNTFKNKEFTYPNLYNVLNTVAAVMIKNKSSITSYNQSSGSIELWINSNNVPRVVNDLMNTGIFSNVEVLRVSETRLLTGKSWKSAQLELQLKGVNR